MLIKLLCPPLFFISKYVPYNMVMHHCPRAKVTVTKSIFKVTTRYIFTIEIQLGLLMYSGVKTNVNILGYAIRYFCSV